MHFVLHQALHSSQNQTMGIISWLSSMVSLLRVCRRRTSHPPESELLHVAIPSSPCRGGCLSLLVPQINFPHQPPRAGKLVVPLAFGSRLAETGPDLFCLVCPGPSTLDQGPPVGPAPHCPHAGCVYTPASAWPWLPQD